MAVQFHRPDLDEGLILCFRHPESPYRTIEVRLHGLDSQAIYRLAAEDTGALQKIRGAELLRQWHLTLPGPGRSEVIVYRREP